MACIEGALKGSFRKETALKPNNAFEETYGPQSVMVSVDDFSVDDLLDFSNMANNINNEDEFLTLTADDDEEEEDDDEGNRPTSRDQNLFNNGSDGSSVKEKDHIVSIELGLFPEGDMEDLEPEWLSQFVEDSFTEHSLTTHQHAATVPKPVNRVVQEPLVATAKETGSAVNPCFTSPVPVKTRSKRARTGRGWSLGAAASLVETTSSSSTTSSTSSNSVDSVFNSVVKPRAAKKLRRGAGGEPAGSGQPQRRCSHCGVLRTPQWRAGPLGAKTLCNACGVRFKSGRLLPEYRPACSPMFSSELHSNSHRKVLEMRRKKEGELRESGLVSVGF